jgi:uncharacterized protein YheU (UPF0270 family)
MSEPVEIPLGRLSPEALRGLIEEYVLREGTDYGLNSWMLQDKSEQVMRQIRYGRAKVYYDPTLGSTTIVPTEFGRF